MDDRIALTVNGKPMEVAAGTSAAAAALLAQGPALRESVSAQPRGPLCGMGICFECRVTIDGSSQQRSCQIPCVPDMRIETARANPEASATAPTAGPLLPPRESHTDVLVLGAGPAGIAAACRAAEAGKQVTLVDDNPQVGGQIWRRDILSRTLAAEPWLESLRNPRIAILGSSQVFAWLPPRTVWIDSPDRMEIFHANRIILACGARERFLPFPGWTLPGVYGAGGLQALVKGGMPIQGKRVVLAGSGPLLLAVADFLNKRGAHVGCIAEQAPRGRLLGFGASLMLHQPRKGFEGLGLLWRLRNNTYRAGCWPIRAEGTTQVTSVVLTDGTRTWTEPCDALACGFGLVPNLELPRYLGCAVEGGSVRVDERQRTSVPEVYAVGELTGVGGLEKALVEGQIAGWTAAGWADRATALDRQRVRARRFVEQLDEAFALRPELQTLAADDTVVCRCEDVAFGRLRPFHGWREAKLHTRCGMGPCQGRVCAPAIEFLLGWARDTERPPVFPTKMQNLRCPSAAGERETDAPSS